MTDRRFVYMDHAATTAIAPEVLEAMQPYLGAEYGNPSGVYRHAAKAQEAADSARDCVAGLLGADAHEIYFTSGGTESDNLALRGVALASRDKGKHIITTTIEHSAVTRTCEQLANVFGFRVTYLPVDGGGLVDPDAVRDAICDDTTLISVMYANNEVGTVEPIAQIGELAREQGIVFHADAVQAGGYLVLDVERLNVDLLSLSGHKFCAPKGVGALYVRQGTPIVPMQTGGGQERGLRAGTENVPGIVGMAAALRLAYERVDIELPRLTVLRDRLVHGVLEAIPDAELTGHPQRRLPNNASFVFRGVEGEAIVTHLDLMGVAASSGSACSAGETRPSHVLTAMGLESIAARGGLRLTLGSDNDDADVDFVLEVLPGIVERLRATSPLYRSLI